MNISGSKFYIFICVFACIVGVADYFHFYPFNSKKDDTFLQQKIQFKGIVVAEPEQREFNTKLTVKISSFDGTSSAKNAPDNSSGLTGSQILVSADRYSNFSYGDVLKISGKLEKPENFLGNTGKEFDYVDYLDAKGISYLIKYPKIYKVGHDPPSRVAEALINLKRTFIDKIEELLSEPESSLGAGLLIDGKRSISSEMQDEFKKVGIVHIVVLSGFNVTIVAETIFKIFALMMPRLFSIGFASVGIILFAIMTGATTTIIRASIMALLALLAKANFRQYSAGRALFLTGFVMVSWNPEILLHDPSFQLSFMATFSVIFIVPRYEKYFVFVPERFGLRGLVSATTITQLFLLPMLIAMTGTVSLVALVVNFLVLPFIPISMLVTFIMVCVGFINNFLAIPVAFVANIFLAYTLVLVKWFSALPFAQVEVSFIPNFFLWALYVVFGVVILINRRTSHPSKREASQSSLSP